MQLKTLLANLPAGLIIKQRIDSPDPEIKSLHYDSRRVQSGSLFFAVQGAVTDGHLYLDDVRKRGCRTVISERPLPRSWKLGWVQVKNIREAMALAANIFFGNPSQSIRLVGVTGTNGKTTTSLLVHSILSLKDPALIMGTLSNTLVQQSQPSIHTTPEAIDIQSFLQDGLARGCRFGVLEVSSHALHFRRILGCHFPVAVFTNLSQDHLDFHSSLEDYFEAKRLLFQSDYNPGLETLVINGDDEFGRTLPVPAGAAGIRFGTSPELEVHPSGSKLGENGLEVTLHVQGRQLRLASPLLGEHNLMNIMAAVTACSALGIEDDLIRKGIQSVRTIPGRFEKVRIEAPFIVVVDYAHTSEALRNVLQLSKKISKGKTICVFGCGGDRDRLKRPLMGQIASDLSDLLILTSDNPRHEDPEQIVQEIVGGISSSQMDRVSIEIDRRKAIELALDIARAGDVVLIAGKGHETYQEVGNQRLPFDDRSVVEELCSPN